MRIVGALMMVFGLAYFWTVANAYTTTGYRLPSNTVTYSCGSPELRQAVQAWANVSGLVDGGCSDTPMITMHIVNDALIPPPIQGWGGAGELWIPARNTTRYGIILHEVGHAIGLGHSAESFNAPLIQRNAAMFAYCCNPINEDDIAGITSLYGPEPPAAILPRAVSAMVAYGG